MHGKYTLVLGLHLLMTALALKIINYILPFLTVCVGSCVFSIIAWVCIAWVTFQYTKSKYLDDKVATENRAVLITGCDSGFGNAIAKRLHSRGFRVFASCLFPDGEGASRLKASCPDRLHILPLDVKEDESVAQAVEYVKQNIGSSDLWAVINNAGILKGFSVDMSTMGEFRDVFEVNFFGTVRVTKAFLPLLKKSQGRIVNVTSLGGEISLPFMTPYLASKYAAVGFSDCLRHEIAMEKITVVTVEPEMFRTALSSPDTILKNLHSSVSGEDEKKKSLECLISAFLSFSCPDISLVVDDLEAAVTQVHPDHTYKPRRHALGRFLYFCYEVMPRSLQILLVKNLSFVFFSESKILRNILLKIVSLIV